MNITLIKALKKNIFQLIEMNKQLMEDEQYDRILNDNDLYLRWKLFLKQKKYKIFLFQNDAIIIGYAVVETDKYPYYLRHFFISRQFRRRGYGAIFFKKMLEELKTKTIDLDVMTWNKQGIGFWKSLGFKERCITMNYSQ